MELNDLPQMDPRALKATSVKAEDEHANSAEPQALKITAASSNPKMFTLPWHKPLATWPEDLLANLPRGISRHVVRFVHVGDEVYAMKEITRQVAEREYEILRRLQKLELPTVTPIAVVIGRHTREGEPLEAILVTRHLKFSLPYRALFARNLRPDTAERLIDALAVLLVRLHLAGFYWGDVSLSNVLFLRDADAFSAFLVDAETGDLQAQLTDGQREYDIDLARTNIIGELMDLASGKLLPGDVDEIEVGNRLVDRYHSLWSALTDTDKFNPDEMWKIEQRVNKLNDLGFDVDELEMKTAEDGKRVLVRPRVVNLTKALEGLKERGYYVVGLDGGGDKLVGETGFESDPLVVVLGSEGSGLGRLVRETCDAIAGIPISSSVESLNASVAAGISLYAVSNARRKAAAE